MRVAAISLQPSFAQEHMLLSLHVWMMLVRLRAEGPDGKTSAQLMYEEFTEDVEARLRGTGVKVRALLTLAACVVAADFRPQLLNMDCVLRCALANIWQSWRRCSTAAAWHMTRYAR